MNEFDSILKRSFAEVHEPSDDGFSVRVAEGVARRERTNRAFGLVQAAGMSVAGVAIVYGAYAVASIYGQDLLASAGLEFARVHGALSTGAPAVSTQSQGILQSIGAGLSQILLVTAALAGGAVAYRAAQE